MDDKLLDLSENVDVEENKVVQKPDYKSEIISIIRINYSTKAMSSKLEDYNENDIE